MEDPNQPPQSRTRRDASLVSVRFLRLCLDLTFSDRVALTDAQIAEAISRGMLDFDRNNWLFPGITWPEAGDRLVKWSVSITDTGKHIHDPALAAKRAARRFKVDLKNAALYVPLAEQQNAAADLLDHLGGLDRQIESLMSALAAALSRVWQSEALIEESFDDRRDPTAALDAAQATVNDIQELLRSLGPKDGS